MLRRIGAIEHNTFIHYIRTIFFSFSYFANDLFNGTFDDIIKHVFSTCAHRAYLNLYYSHLTYICLYVSQCVCLRNDGNNNTLVYARCMYVHIGYGIWMFVCVCVDLWMIYKSFTFRSYIILFYRRKIVFIRNCITEMYVQRSPYSHRSPHASESCRIGKRMNECTYSVRRAEGRMRK